MTATRTIRLPYKLDVEHVLQFAHEIDSVRGSKHLTVDMGDERYFPPFSMLFLAAKFLEFREANAELTIEAVNLERHPYPAHMGFFRWGFHTAKRLGKRKGVRGISRFARFIGTSSGNKTSMPS
jgi:hypothetical protein